MELQTVSDVREFFREALQAALDHQHLQVQDHTEHYIVNLLAMFSHTDALFEPGEERSQLKPLALLLAEAVDAPDDLRRFRALQRLVPEILTWYGPAGLTYPGQQAVLAN